MMELRDPQPRSIAEVLRIWEHGALVGTGTARGALLADSSRLNADTGWRTTIDLRSGVKRTIAWWRNRLADGLVRRERAFIT